MKTEFLIKCICFGCMQRASRDFLLAYQLQAVCFKRFAFKMRVKQQTFVEQWSFLFCFCKRKICRCALAYCSRSKCTYQFRWPYVRPFKWSVKGTVPLSCSILFILMHLGRSICGRFEIIAYIAFEVSIDGNRMRADKQTYAAEFSWGETKWQTFVQNAILIGLDWFTVTRERCLCPHYHIQSFESL